MSLKSASKTRLRAKGQITLPNEIRTLLDVSEGDDLLFQVNDDEQIILKKGIIIPAEQAWFWTERWQRMEKEAQADIDQGRVYPHKP